MKKWVLVYIALPPEAGAPPGKCGRLKRWLYGMRPAASAWEDDYAAKLLTTGFTRGASAPAAFFCESSGARLVVDGDGFTSRGHGADLKRIATLMST